MEVENIPIEQSMSKNFSEKETFITDVNISDFYGDLFGANEGDIFSVEHDGNDVIYVIQEEIEEKMRRVEIIKNLLQS